MQQNAIEGPRWSCRSRWTCRPVFRGIFLSLGVAVVTRFTTVLFGFAAVLFYSAYKLRNGEEETHGPGVSGLPPESSGEGATMGP
ncbi:putative tellurium resistance membrane protein TerC [Streptomyces sp. PvR006]|uniref:hypothetical protein n=1 Tax=Streptomyces sp. PvR006 TaxID=2817860 RepID=UPI0035AC1BAC|nr:putative tellurium resistance membrane protein TerC [Streptomyces sp. PvR006]